MVYYRNYSLINRDPSYIDNPHEEPYWMKDFLINLAKISTKSRRQDYALFDQINSAIDSKSKYSSVDEAVADMCKRTGLDIFLKSTAQSNSLPEQSSREPEIFKTLPQLKTFIDNYVEAHPGTIVQAVKESIMKINEFKTKLPNNELPEDVQRYINNKIISGLKERTNTNTTDTLQLGKVDLNTETNVVDDPLAGCMPHRDGK